MTLLAPGSHRLKQGIKIPEGRPDPEGSVELRLKAGDAVFFENRTWHAGALNLSGRTRKAVMFGYAFRWMKPIDYAIQSKTLTNRMDDIGKQLLGSYEAHEGRAWS